MGVYHLLFHVPRGCVTTYGAVAQATKSCGQAVGQACRRNPFYPTVPCYRIVNAGGIIGGLFGQVSLNSPMVKKKIRMLSREGVLVKNGRLPDFSDCNYAFPMAQKCAALRLKASLERHRHRSRLRTVRKSRKK